MGDDVNPITAHKHFAFNQIILRGRISVSSCMNDHKTAADGRKRAAAPTDKTVVVRKDKIAAAALHSYRCVR